MSRNVRVDRRVAGDRRSQERYAAFERRNGLPDRRVAAWERPTFEPVDQAPTTAFGDTAALPTESAAKTTKKTPPLRAVLIACDLGCLAVAWLAIGFAAHRSYGQRWSLVFEAAAFMVAATGLMLRYSGLYRSRVSAMRSVELTKLGRVGAGAGATAYALGLLPRDHAWLAVAAVALTFFTLAAERSVYRAWIRSLRRKGRCLRRVVVVGSAADIEVMVSLVADFPELGYEVSGVVSVSEGTGAEAAETGSLAELVTSRARELDTNGLLVATGAMPPVETARVLRDALVMGLHVQLWGGLPGVHQRRLQPQPLGHQPAFYLAPSRMSEWQQRAKRVLDLTVAPLALLVAFPVLFIVAVLVKREDGGPVIFRQQRIGKDGRDFTLFKFRSMTVDAETRLSLLVDQNERRGPLFKVDDDPRVTRIGKFLRATSLDELPQLINVVRGEMTLVGPRPALAHEVAQFDEELLRRLLVAPGVTGLWQVEGRDNPSFEAYRSLDLFYIENWSLGVDLAILMSTTAVVVGRAARVLLSRRTVTTAEAVAAR
jgi:exopolysaccharide biosynthesis polyprenyl glycosylphosphotransferase